MEKQFYTSYSKMDTYKECPQQYTYRYLDKLEPKSKKRALYVGTHIHKLIELFYIRRNPELYNARVRKCELLDDELKNDPDNKELAKKVEEAFYATVDWRTYLKSAIRYEFDEVLSDTDRAEVGLTYIQDLAVIMAQYEYYYSQDKIEVLDIEHNKKCSLGTYNGQEVVLTFICDGIVRLPNGKNYILEHKTYSRDPMTFEETWLNTQTAIYVSALRSQGWDIEGVLWDNVKSACPKKPNILKSGAYGKQDGNVTLFSFIDWNTIMEGPEAVVKFINNLPQEVKDLGVEGNKDGFLSRHITVFNEKAVDEILKDTQSVLEEITKEKPLIYRNLGWTCNGCAFKSLCQAQMLGQDVSLILSTLFNKKD